MIWDAFNYSELSRVSKKQNQLPFLIKPDLEKSLTPWERN